jgi:hypothetical protein
LTPRNDVVAAIAAGFCGCHPRASWFGPPSLAITPQRPAGFNPNGVSASRSRPCPLVFSDADFPEMNRV